MAVKTIFLSDLSGDDGASRHTFAIDGFAYEIDITDAELDALKEALAPYAAVGRRINLKTGAVAKGKQHAANPRAVRIREWATAAGYSIPKRGRLPHYIISEYEKEHGEDAP